MAFKSHLPEFGYAVSRPYPYKWFNWVVFTGGVIATLLFSFINFAADGYQLEVQYTTTPNDTVSQDSWFSHAPISWFAKVSTTCQAQTFQVNSQFFTDKLSLPYTITGIFENQTKLNVLPSFQYMQNALEECKINEMLFDMTPATRTANQESFYTWGIEGTVLITCLVYSSGRPTWVNLTTTYDYITPKMTANPGLQGTPFLNLDNSTKASLWWGQSLLGWYYIDLALYMQDVSYNNSMEKIVVKSTFRTEPRWWSATDLTDLMYFHTIDKIIYDQLDPDSRAVVVRNGGFGTDNTTPDYLDQWPQIFPQADQYAKILYSCVLADLGNADAENVLTNPQLLQNWTSVFGERPGSDYMGPAFMSYNNQQSSNFYTGNLFVNGSTIYSEYFCQVTKPKPFGSLVIAIVVADLVFLNALWRILNWTTTMWVDHRDSQAQYCKGCLVLMDKGHELEPMGQEGTSGGRYSPISDMDARTPELVRGRSVSTESREPLTRR